MRVSVNQIALQKHAHGKQCGKGYRELEQVPPEVFTFKKAGPGKKVIQVGNQHRKHKLYGEGRKHAFPIIPTPPLKHGSLV